MANSKIALATDNPGKLKHWSQAIKDLEIEFKDLKNSIIPKNHACMKDTFGLGDEIYYGHVKLLDDLIYDYIPTTENQYWVETFPVNAKSSDSQIANIEDGTWYDMTYHNGLLVVVGSDRRIVTSYDNGETWDDVHIIGQSGPNFDFHSVEWCGNCFIAVGSYNVFAYSYDGRVWYDPLYVGGAYIDGILEESTSDDIGISKFTESDIWYGITYDKQTGFIHLVGTQAKTLCCKFFRNSTGNGSNSFKFQQTLFPLNIINDTNITISDVTLYDVECKYGIKDKKHYTTVIACGSNNYVFSATYYSNQSWPIDLNDTVNQFRWSNLVEVEDEQNVVQPDTDEQPDSIYHPITGITINWKKIFLNEINNTVVFMLFGNNGMCMQSTTGLYDSWTKPVYEFENDNIDINTISGYNNLYVIAGDNTNTNNIIRYNGNTKPELSEENGTDSGLQEDIENARRDELPSTNTKKLHLVENYVIPDNVIVSWYGSCYCENRFFLCGDNNRIIYCDVYQNNEKYAISLEFYRKYIKILEDRILELERNVISNNLTYKTLYGYGLDGLPSGPVGSAIQTTNEKYIYGTELENNQARLIEPISYEDKSTLLYYTSGLIRFTFIPAPITTYKELIIYLESIDDTNIYINESDAEWENDLYMADWGKAGFHLTLKAIFVGGRVIIQILDNDQLADNLLENNPETPDTNTNTNDTNNG